MDEYLDIVDKSGKPTGQIALKSEAHSKGLYHNTVHVWLYTSKAEILLQQRSHKKTIYPLLWDVSVAGHIDAGETFIEAALRETKEEIGLRLEPNDLKHIGVFLHETSYADGQIQDNEFHQVFIAELKTPLNQLNIQEAEVEALKLVSLEEFKILLENSKTNNHFVTNNADYYKFISKTITKKHKL
ncbi:NUDIX hydrolase [Winogradskyella bathintestinalis]|uniref:NUDIX domain-containing protein n=1 Tax=Winogradskyella bathintestinalis TaxID=3035208 RepID=A0ABT7ZWG2_9FLAO|nr:NUDIX domain-containing protein [Winogradskyella bathintestinalis]MDN3493164.1 NUDIX domain-containing protein [Winogradskyella bathintestinalis]